jgi:LmbE family N-acetylglucosaminyl deacetylase
MAVAFLIPHPDDEIFALPLLEQFSREKLYFICFTDGQFSRSEELGLRRYSEFNKSISYLNRIGIRSEILVFDSAHEIRDGFMHEDFTVDMLSKLLNLVKSLDLSTIVAPALEGGHQDHDSVSLISIFLEKYSKVNLIHFSTYRSTSSFLPTFTVMKPTVRGYRLEFRRIRTFLIALRLISIYRSQFRTFIFLGFPILITYLGKTLYTARNVERLAIHSYLYERRSKASFKDVSLFSSRVLGGNDQHG